MRARGVAVALALILLPMFSAPVRADGPALPAEPGARVLDGEVVAATTGDIDDDGVADLVRVVRSDSNSTLLAVDAWSVNSDGRWTRHEQVPLRREASVDRQLSGLPRPDADGMLPVRFGDPVGFLVVGSASSTPGGSHVMVAAIGTADEDPACCLTIWEVGARSGGTAPAITLDLALASGRGAAWIIAARLDPDGEGDYDQILVGDTDTTAAARLTVLGWSGGRYREIARRIYPLGSTLLTWASKPLVSPGLERCAPHPPEVAVLGPPHPADEDSRVLADLTVLALSGGRLTDEIELIDTPGFLSADAVRADSVLMSTIDGRMWFGWGWPSTSDEPIPRLDANALATAFGGSPWTPLQLLSLSGPITDANALTIISDECFAEIASLRTGQVAARFPGRFVGGNVESVSLLPYRGEIPGFSEYNDGGGVITDGNLLRFVPDGTAQVVASAALPGMVPIGLVGPNGGWMALAESSRFPVHNRGFRLDTYQVGDAARVSVAPGDQVLSPEAEGGSFHPRLVGAVLDPARSLGDLLTGGAGFRAEAEVPPGSRLFVAPLGEGFPVAPTWEGRADDGHAVFQVAVPAGRNSFNMRGFVVTPAGHGYTVAWFVKVLREPPQLQVEGEWASLGFDVPIHGSTDPKATILVDGVAVAVAGDGTFNAHVTAPPWPTRVVVEAVDLVGNRTTTTLSVVGLLDYRELPWVPIIVWLTVVAGAGLFLLAPRLRPPPVTSHPDDGTLEDLDDR
ncbi:MAG: hypothetical protein WED12_07535 [Chloroflexota bacterium]